MPPATKSKPAAAAAKKGSKASLTYASAGVDIDKKDAFTESLDAQLRSTYNGRVLPNPGGFAGLFRLDFNQKLFRRNYKDPVLVACCDGVGTKVLLARELSTFDTVGIDLVAMNVNDLVVQGAEPLFFLDYIAVPEVDTTMLHALVKGIARACKDCDCALLGGETANMPDIYRKGDFDLAGFCVGVVELKRTLKPTRVQVGDVVLGLKSDGVHSNGYSLVRHVVKHANLDLSKVYPELDAKQTLGQVLLTPTRLYAPPITKLLRGYRVKNVVSGMAHITGSGLEGNLCRALPPTLDAVVDRASWPVPPVFPFLQKHGNISDVEMHRIFNMGVGYCVIVRPSFADSIKKSLEKLGETVSVIGEIKKGTGIVRVK